MTFVAKTPLLVGGPIKLYTLALHEVSHLPCD